MPPKPFSYSEGSLIQLPAIELLSDMGWEIVGGFDEFKKGVSLLERATEADVILSSRLEPVIKRLNPRLNREAVELALEELSRDRSKMSLANANREVYQMLKEGVKVNYRDDSGEDTTDSVKL